MPAAKPGGKKELYNPMQEWGDMFTDAQGLEDYEETGNPYRVQPVDIQTFVTSKDYLGVDDYGGLSPRQLELTEKATDMENGIEFIVALAGKNSGKNFTCAVIFLYATYKMLCMYDCHKYLGIPRISMLTLINVSINEKQARKTFFDPLITILKNAGDMAFKQFDWKPIDGVTILTDEIKFPKHNIQLLSMNSKAGASEGYNLVLGMADEIDAIEFISVDNIVKTLRTSSNTRFSGGKGKAIVISYKRFIGSSGKIEEYYQKYKGFSSVYTTRGATWDFNPSKKKEDFAEYFKTNPESAEIELGSAEGTSLNESWIKDSKRLEASMVKSSPSVLGYPTIKDTWLQEPTAETHYTIEGVNYKLDPYNIPLTFNPTENQHLDYIFICDPGEGSDLNGGDAFGITMGHRELVETSNGVFEPRPVVDFSFRLIGRMFDEKQVQFRTVEMLADKLNAFGYRIKIYSFDGYQSVSIAQSLSKKYPDALVYTRNLVADEDYASLYSAITSQVPPSNGDNEKDSGTGISLPHHPILLWELQNLVVAKGRVNHRGKVSSKDIADTVAKLCYIVKEAYPLQDVHLSGVGEKPKPQQSKVFLDETFEQQRFRQHLDEVDAKQRDLKKQQDLAEKTQTNYNNELSNLMGMGKKYS